MREKWGRISWSDCVVGREGGEKKLMGLSCFFPIVHQNSISPNWGDYKRENKMLLVAFEQIYPSSRYILDVWGMGSFVVGLLWTFWSFWLFFFYFFGGFLLLLFLVSAHMFLFSCFGWFLFLFLFYFNKLWINFLFFFILFFSL